MLYGLERKVWWYIGLENILPAITRTLKSGICHKEFNDEITYTHLPQLINKKWLPHHHISSFSLLLLNWVYLLFCQVLEQKQRAMSPSGCMLIVSRNSGNRCWHIYIPLLMSNGRDKLIYQRNCHLRGHLGKGISLHKWAIYFFYNLPPTLLVKVEQLGWKWWMTLNGQLLKSCNFSGSHWAEDSQLFWQQDKLSSRHISVPKWPCTPVRCKSQEHFSFFDFLSYLLPRFIPLMSFEFRYLLFFTWTFKSLTHWLAINLVGI